MSNMLETYDISYTGKKEGKKDYGLKFKVAKGVRVTFLSEEDGINKVVLDYDTESTKEKFDKTYKVTGPLKIHFFQLAASGSGKGDPDPGLVDPDPAIEIEP